LSFVTLLSLIARFPYFEVQILMKFTNPLGSLLRHSPFKPIKNHMEVVSEAVVRIPLFFDALFSGDREKVKAIAAEIDEVETQADQIKLDYRSSMPSTLLMPVDRRDLLVLISEQDRIADTADSLVSVFVTRKHMEVPPQIRETLAKLVESSLEVFKQAFDVVAQVENLLEGGFKGREGSRAYEMIAELREAEELNDEIGEKLSRTLYSIEDQLKPIDAMFWYRVIDKIEEISNKAENVGDRVMLLIAR